MENKEHQNLDKFSKKIFTEAAKEKPSFDFTSKVMSQIEATYAEKLIYKPLIPKAIWVLILVSLVFWFSYLFKNHFEGGSGWFSSLDLNSVFSNFNLSKSATYTIILFGVMVCVQVSFLKYYFAKRSQV